MTAGPPPGLRWIGFDLDDTLHFFRRASRRATEAVFAEVERRDKIGADRLDQAYAEILQDARSGHFAAPRTAREYRGERFTALLKAFELDPGPQLDSLLDIYDSELAAALELRPGAGEALAAARRAGLSVMVVSEGPHDAQERTIERLGIAASVDLLVTSAGEGLSKGDGLFERALERAGCRPDELLFAGDSIERDIVPASALDIACVYVGEEELPADSSARRLDLAALARLLDRLAATRAGPSRG